MLIVRSWLVGTVDGCRLSVTTLTPPPPPPFPPHPQGMKEKMRELAKNLGIPNPGQLNM